MEQDTLAHRLRLLRQRQGPLTQPALGAILGVKAPTISSWERSEAPTVPPQERLAAYASLFASPRALRDRRIPDDTELTADERAQRDSLLRELTELRQRALTHEAPVTTADPWHFPDGAPVRIICGKLATPPRTASGHRWNYMALSAFADLDAMVELFGHVRAANPATDVRVELAGRLRGKDLNSHLVLLGNLAQQQTDLRALLPELPVSQVEDDRIDDGEVFVAGGRRFQPVFAGEGSDLRVVEDVGFLARTPSPLDGTRTLTICSGTYTRGVYGAVRTLTDRDMHAANAQYLQDRFGAAPTWGVLMRVRGYDHAIGTPRLGAPDARLFEFPE